jgi:hypothetical protein
MVGENRRVNRGFNVKCVRLSETMRALFRSRVRNR